MTSKSVPEILSEMTGEPIEKFQADDFPLPDWDELEWEDAEEYYE